MKILIVGAGAVARGLANLIKNTLPEWETSFFSSRSPRSTYGDQICLHDAVAVAISNKDSGHEAADLILEAAQNNLPVITCEKGSLSEYFFAIKPYLKKIGYSATVGGGSGIIDLFERPGCGGVKRFKGIINGTLNFIACRLEEKLEIPEAIRQAQEKHLCEPGSNSIVDIINTELLDAQRKAAILYNLAFHDSPIQGRTIVKASEFSRTLWHENGIMQLFAQKKRLVIAVFPRDERNQGIDFFKDQPCFWMHTAHHYIIGTFVHPDGHFKQLPYEEDNCLQLEDWRGEFYMHGPGAGINPTASAMLCDLKKMLNVN